jgi:hypothetical protein
MLRTCLVSLYEKYIELYTHKSFTKFSLKFDDTLILKAIFRAKGSNFSEER